MDDYFAGGGLAERVVATMLVYVTPRARTLAPAPRLARPRRASLLGDGVPSHRGRAPVGSLALSGSGALPDPSHRTHGGTRLALSGDRLPRGADGRRPPRRGARGRCRVRWGRANPPTPPSAPSPGSPAAPLPPASHAGPPPARRAPPPSARSRRRCRCWWRAAAGGASRCSGTPPPPDAGAAPAPPRTTSRWT